MLTDKHAPDEALKVLARSKVTFKGNIEATIQTAAVESTVYGSMGQTDKAEAAMATAEDLMSQLPGKVSTEVAMEMAQSMLKIGKKEQAFELLSDLVKNNHENLDISRQVANVFESVNMKEEGQALIQESRQEVININNQGVLLAKKGEYQEGAKLLRTAIQNLPNSEVVAFNIYAVVMAALRATYPDKATNETVSEYYIAQEIDAATDGMSVAIPDNEWRVFREMSLKELGLSILYITSFVDLKKYKKNPRGPKKPQVERNEFKGHPHVSTAKLLKGITPKILSATG